MRGLGGLALVVALCGCSLGLDFGDPKKARSCSDAGECLAGWYCQEGTCLEANPCQSAATCPATWACKSNRCEQGCESASDCAGTGGCKLGTCRAQHDLDAACEKAVDCYVSEVCLSDMNLQNGFCTHDCSATRTCPTAYHCAAVSLVGGTTRNLCLRDCLTTADCTTRQKCIDIDGAPLLECVH